MDERPPRPLRPRQSQRPASPEQKPGNPLGGMLGSLLAGTWCFIFIYWLKLSGIPLLVVCALGFVLVSLGLILLGVTVGEVLGRHRHG